MPTLRRRKDGCCYIHHFYESHHTWQIDGDGVLYLKRRGIRDGDWFSTTLFMKLWSLGLIYHGDVSPNRSPLSLRVTEAESTVVARIREFHQLIHSSQLDAAWEIVYPDSPERVTPEQFRIDLMLAGSLASWVIRDVI